MQNQAGFTLFELLIAITIIAILSSIGIPTYKNYINRAAITEMLTISSPYKMAVEFCFLENGELKDCDFNNLGIQKNQNNQYVADIDVKKGIISIKGQKTLKNLTVSLTPKISAETDSLNWERTCTSKDELLKSSCESIFKI